MRTMNRQTCTNQVYNLANIDLKEYLLHTKTRLEVKKECHNHEANKDIKSRNYKPFNLNYRDVRQIISLRNLRNEVKAVEPF